MYWPRSDTQKPKKNTRRHGLVLAGMLMALVLLLASAVPAFAASEKVEGVLSQLTHLQRVHISPEWLPDIRTNEKTVQRLLDGYTRLTLSERRELSAQNKADLRAYFNALYQVQGKDVAEVDALFTDTTAASSSTSSTSQASSSASSSRVSSSSGSTSSSSRASSSSSASSNNSSAAPSSASSNADDASSAVDSSMPLPALVLPSSAEPPVSSSDVSLQGAGIVNPPQTPKGGGWLSFFGSNTLGAGLLMLLLLVALGLFIRFLMVLRRAEKETAPKIGVDMRAQELFGENYDPLEDPVSENFLPPLPRSLTQGGAAVSSDELPPMMEDELTEKPRGSFSMFAPENAPDTDKEGFWDRRKRRKADEISAQEPDDDAPPMGDDNPLPKAEATGRQTPPPVAATSRFDKAFASLTGADAAAQESHPEAENAPEKAPVPKPENSAPAKPPFGTNPDRRNSITTRSFGAPPRTGRPGKMPFRQGDPDDLAAIDE